MRDSIADGIGKRGLDQGPFNQSVMDLDYESNWKKVFDKCGAIAKSMAEANQARLMKSQPVKEEQPSTYEGPEGDDDDDQEEDVTLQVQVSRTEIVKPKVQKMQGQPLLGQPVSLQSAIVLSEILGPPRCKNRRNRVGRSR